MWTRLSNQEEVNTLIEIYGGFHDTCIKEMHYVSGAYVSKELGIHPLNDIRTLQVVFQRQRYNPFEIIVEFQEVMKLNLEPTDMSQTCEILDVSFFFENDILYWADSVWFESQRETYSGTWIAAKSAKWRGV